MQQIAIFFVRIRYKIIRVPPSFLLLHPSPLIIHSLLHRPYLPQLLHHVPHRWIYPKFDLLQSNGTRDQIIPSPWRLVRLVHVVFQGQEFLRLSSRFFGSPCVDPFQWNLQSVRNSRSIVGSLTGSLSRAFTSFFHIQSSPHGRYSARGIGGIHSILKRRGRYHLHWARVSCHPILGSRPESCEHPVSLTIDTKNVASHREKLKILLSQIGIHSVVVTPSSGQRERAVFTKP